MVVICETPSGYVRVVWSVTQGALRGFAAARPWAVECNTYGVRNMLARDSVT